MLEYSNPPIVVKWGGIAQELKSTEPYFLPCSAPQKNRIWVKWNRFCTLIPVWKQSNSDSKQKYWSIHNLIIFASYSANNNNDKKCLFFSFLPQFMPSQFIYLLQCQCLIFLDFLNSLLTLDIQISCVKPVENKRAELDNPSVPREIKFFYQVNEVDTFLFDRPYHRGERDKNNEFKVMPNSFCLSKFST